MDNPTNYSELLEWIENRLPRLGIRSVRKLIKGKHLKISEKSYYNIKRGEELPGEIVKRVINDFVKEKFNKEVIEKGNKISLKDVAITMKKSDIITDSTVNKIGRDGNIEVGHASVLEQRVKDLEEIKKSLDLTISTLQESIELLKNRITELEHPKN